VHASTPDLSRLRHARTSACVVTVVALAACAGHAASPGSVPASNGPAPAISAADLRRRLFAFSDDSMLGREAGTVGNVKATNYIATEVAKLGLLPAGDNGTFFQAVPLVRRHVDPGSTLIVDGATLTLGQDYVVLPTLGGTFGTTFTSPRAQAVYGGRLSDSAAPLTADQTAGKVVVFGAPLGPDGQPIYQLRRSMLNRYPNAAAVMIGMLDLAPPQVMGTLSRPQTAIAASGAAMSPIPRPAGLLVTQAVASRMLGAPVEGLQPGTTGRAVVATVRMIESPTEATARNVVAILPGSDPTLAHEYVAIGGHNDHLGVADHAVDHDSARAALTMRWQLRGLDPEGPAPTPAQVAAIHVNVDSLHRLRPARRDSIYNGADDDGSGSVSVLEIAQAFAKSRTRPRRSILFVWHTAEEKGLLGSQYFTDHPTPSVNRDSIVAQLNMDMVGRGDSADIKGGGPLAVELVGSRRLSTELGDLVETVNQTEPQPLVFDYQFDANGHPENIYCRSDHYEYARYGIPVVFFTTGLHQDYHQLTDEAQYIDYDHMARVDRLVYDVATRVADLDHRVVVDKPKPDPHGVCRQ
jgi:hypothetical protein